MVEDNRIRFPSPRVDFDTDVGITGQDHDTYPAPGQQPRYDWMRLFLIGLLSSQASASEPTEYRNGSLWFDLSENVMKVRSANAWVNIANAIKLDDDSDGTPVTLANIYDTIKSLLGYKPTANFSGHSTQDGITSIQIPTSLRAAAGAGSRPFIWVDGVLIDPRNCEYVGGTEPVSIRLTGGNTIDNGQTFTVLMVAIDTAYFSSDEVVL